MSWKANQKNRLVILQILYRRMRELHLINGWIFLQPEEFFLAAYTR
jgi:hypothetical protein